MRDGSVIPPGQAARDVPSGEARPGLVGALVEGEHRLARVRLGARVVVAQDGEMAAALGDPSRRLRPQRLAAQPVRLGSGVGVEGGLGKGVVAEPEP